MDKSTDTLESYTPSVLYSDSGQDRLAVWPVLSSVFQEGPANTNHKYRIKS